MKIKTTDIYHIVDEKYLANFSQQHISFMKDFYFNFYNSYCSRHKIEPLSQDRFFINMRRHKIKLVQICCPYCGNMRVMGFNGKIEKLEKMNYCTSCGKRSVSENAIFQLSRLLRIQNFHSAGLKAMKKEYTADKLKIITYDIYQLELIEIASILEVMLRDIFLSFVYINYKSKPNSYIESVVNKNIGNDFMNIVKANDHYKKALNINLRSAISDECWNSLVDIVNMRNTIVHNNGLMDRKFKKSETYNRIKKIANGDLIFFNQENIDFYLNNVVEIISAISSMFNERYSKSKYSLIVSLPNQIVTQLLS